MTVAETAVGARTNYLVLRRSRGNFVSSIIMRWKHIGMPATEVLGYTQ